MRLQTFVAGSLVAVVTASLAAFVAGMSWYAVLGLAVSVWVAAQVLYLGVVALLALEAGRSSSGARVRNPERSGATAGKHRSDSDRA